MTQRILNALPALQHDFDSSRFEVRSSVILHLLEPAQDSIRAGYAVLQGLDNSMHLLGENVILPFPVKWPKQEAWRAQVAGLGVGQGTLQKALAKFPVISVLQTKGQSSKNVVQQRVVSHFPQHVVGARGRIRNAANT